MNQNNARGTENNKVIDTILSALSSGLIAGFPANEDDEDNNPSSWSFPREIGPGSSVFENHYDAPRRGKTRSHGEDSRRFPEHFQGHYTDAGYKCRTLDDMPRDVCFIKTDTQDDMTQFTFTYVTPEQKIAKALLMLRVVRATQYAIEYEVVTIDPHYE